MMIDRRIPRNANQGNRESYFNREMLSRASMEGTDSASRLRWARHDEAG